MLCYVDSVLIVSATSSFATEQQKCSILFVGRHRMTSYKMIIENIRVFNIFFIVPLELQNRAMETWRSSITRKRFSIISHELKFGGTRAHRHARDSKWEYMPCASSFMYGFVRLWCICFCIFLDRSAVRMSLIYIRERIKGFIVGSSTSRMQAKWISHCPSKFIKELFLAHEQRSNIWTYRR